MSIAENIARIRERTQEAAVRSGRNSNDIGLMAVSKGVSASQINEAFNCGLRLFGENRVQEFEEKYSQLQGLALAQWHMIGHLQTNKASRAAELFCSVDSVDSVRLARKLNSAAREQRKNLPVLIEINIGQEEAKSGLSPETPELEELLGATPELNTIQICGLMAVPPYNEDPEKSRPYFRAMRELFHSIENRNLACVRMDVLSMGMSHDFEIAIEEGSTCVRIGTAIFGERAAVRRHV